MSEALKNYEMNVLTVTMNPTIDTSLTVDQVRPDVKLRSNKPRHEPGGGGINVSRAISILGGNSTAYFMAGGTNGTMLEQLLDEQDMNYIAVPIEGLTRENITVFEESSDQQFRFVLPGPEISNEECNEFTDKLKSVKEKPDYIVISGSSPPGVPADTYARIAKRGKELGAKVIIDTKGEELKHALEEGVFLIKPNLRELRDLSGKELKNENEIQAAAKKIHDNGQSKIVVVSMGAGGVMVVSEEFTGKLTAPTVPIKSKVGAGDSTVAGITLFLSRRKPLIESILYGIAAGASAVMTGGTELCTRDDTDYLFARLMQEYSESN